MAIHWHVVYETCGQDSKTSTHFHSCWQMEISQWLNALLRFYYLIYPLTWSLSGSCEIPWMAGMCELELLWSWLQTFCAEKLSHSNHVSWEFFTGIQKKKDDLMCINIWTELAKLTGKVDKHDVHEFTPFLNLQSSEISRNIELFPHDLKVTGNCGQILLNWDILTLSVVSLCCVLPM